MIQVPGIDAEDARQFRRELDARKRERTRHVVRIRSLLVCRWGQIERIGADFLKWPTGVLMWIGSTLPPQLESRLRREYERFTVLSRPIADLEVQRQGAIRRLKDQRMERL